MAKRAQHTVVKLVRMSPELVDAITEWRRKQPALPSEAEAIRRLIEFGLRAAEQEARRPSGA